MKVKDLSEAEICREKGWGPGTILEGDEGYGAERILITAVGERSILARLIMARGGVEAHCKEALWTLKYREWKEVK